MRWRVFGVPTEGAISVEGALYYNIARQAFPDCYEVCVRWSGETLITIKGALYYNKLFPVVMVLCEMESL